MRQPTILLVGDYASVSGASRKILEQDFEIVGVASEGRSALRIAAQLEPEVIVLDLSTRLIDDFNPGPELKKQFPRTKLIVLTTNEDSEAARHSLRLWASGYLLKKSADSELVTAIREALAGNVYAAGIMEPQLEEQFIRHPKFNHNGSMKYSEPCCKELARDTLERSKDIIFMVDSQLTITYCNPAWDKFAIANGGEEVVGALVLGTDLMRVIPESLHDFYSDVFERCQLRQSTFDFDYECSSAEQYRLDHMTILPLRRSGELAIVNSVRVERIHGAQCPALSSEDVYFNVHGMLTVCSHCRRTRRQDIPDVWDWVPAFLQTRKWKISHGMCPVCVSYFYSHYLAARTTVDAA
jgi:DNA-binding NarL/FixJ family response regulator